MSQVVIDRDKLRRIVQGSYKEIRKYEQKITNTKTGVVKNIISIMEKELKNEADKD